MNISGGSSAPTPTPPRVPGLVLLRRLGTGGHGEVWLAADLASGERVAVKVGRGVDGNPDQENRLAREVALLRRIDHPHVVPLRRVIDLPDGGRALVMELAAGGSLADLVAGRGPLEAPEACTVIVPLARTLAELHGRGLVHGDLSPANVLFTAHGRPMIADLGCAVVLGGRRLSEWGTDGYTDPDRTGPPGTPDDVYALGALLRFSLGGDAPGGDARRDALLALADLCTAPDPARRPDPDAVARTALAATPPAPVRLLRSVPPGVDASNDSAADSSRPARPPAAEQGWTRSAPDPDAPTAATALPPTSVDLAVDAAVDAAGSNLPRRQGLRPALAQVDPGQAVTRRRSLPVPDAGAASGKGRRGDPRGREGRRPQHERVPAGTGGSVLHRSLLRTAAVVIGLGAGAVVCWLWLVGGNGGTVEIKTAQPAGPRVSSPSQPGSLGPAVARPAREPVEVAVARLAAGRAAAFGAASVGPLALIDEPGSPALAADMALVGRLNDHGLRLAGLTFRVTGVRQIRDGGQAVIVAADVATSAHRQVTVPRGQVRAAVRASAARRVVLTLVPAPDGRHWLVRDVRGSSAPP